MKVFIVTNFRIDLDDKLPGEMLMDDLVDALRDDSTFVEIDMFSANRRKGKNQYVYTVAVDLISTAERKCNFVKR